MVKTAIVTISENGIPRGFCLMHLAGHKDGARIIRQNKLEPELEALIQEMLKKGSTTK